MILPEGILAEPLARLRAMVAGSAGWQAWTGAADADEAATSVHLLEAPREAATPLCLIDFADGFERRRLSITNGKPFAQRGALVAYFRDAVAADHDPVEAAYAFANRLGAVWRDLELSAGTAGALPATLITLAAAPRRSPSDRRGHADLFEAALALTWEATR